MKKVMLFEPGIGTDNLGDQIIVDGVKQALDSILSDAFVVEFSTHTPLYNRHTKHCEVADYKFICGSNLLVGNLGSIWRFRQWPVDFVNMQSLKSSILVGVGAQKYGQKIGPYTKSIYKHIFEKKFFHSVRDEYSLNRLKSIGINNVLNTGCPTMWGMTKEKCESIATKKAEKVIFTLTDYSTCIERDRFLIDTLKREYEEIYFWCQGSRDYDYLKKIDSLDNINIIPPTLEAYDRFLRDTDGLDYVGTRLHGGMRALQYRKRTIIIGIDNRAKELAKDYNIPVVDDKDIINLGKLITEEWETKIHLPIEAIKVFLGQFEIQY